jgi:hypothetical protein
LGSKWGDSHRYFRSALKSNGGYGVTDSASALIEIVGAGFDAILVLKLFNCPRTVVPLFLAVPPERVWIISSCLATFSLRGFDDTFASPETSHLVFKNGEWNNLFSCWTRDLVLAFCIDRDFAIDDFIDLCKRSDTVSVLCLSQMDLHLTSLLACKSGRI